MTDSHLPPWASSRRPVPAPPHRPPSDSGSSGPGERPARAAGGSAPVRLSSLLSGVIGKTLDQAAEHAFASATREQLMAVAKRMVELDREKAIACSALIAWAAAGADPEVPTLTPASLAWVFTAPLSELEIYGRELVRLCPSVAAHIEVAIHEALEEHEAALRKRATG